MLSVHFDLLNFLWFWLTVLDWTAGIPGKISVNKLSVDLIPNSLKRKHHRNCMAHSKENHWWDLGSERVKLSEVPFLWITQYLTNCTPTPPLPPLPPLPQPNINPNLLSVDCRQEHSCSVVWFLSLWHRFTFFLFFFGICCCCSFF